MFFLGISPSPSSTSCFFVFSPRDPGVSFQWNSSFNSRHVIEMYRVTVTPNLSTCSRDVDTSKNYSCPSLALGTQYTFTVTAINCGDQEGMEYTFTVQPQGKFLYTMQIVHSSLFVTSFFCVCHGLWLLDFVLSFPSDYNYCHINLVHLSYFYIELTYLY